MPEISAADFWTHWANIGKELLEHGQQVKFGHSLLEVKYMNGAPKVIVLSKSIKTKYPDDTEAKRAVARLMDTSERAAFTGARTWTVTYDKGHVSHILIDEYGNTLI